MPSGGGGMPPGKPNGGGGIPPNPPAPIGPLPCSIGFAPACPASAYEFVIESMTDCAFSCPISIPDFC